MPACVWCLFCQASLARRIPYGVHRGVPSGPRHPSWSLPAVVQVRLRCRKGFFKGCLVVVEDNFFRACPSAAPAAAAATQGDMWIVVRPSMRKGDCPAPLLGTGDEADGAALAVNSTFEHKAFVNPDLHEVTDRASEYTIRLNRRLCLLLRERGVPEEFFLNLMRAELARVVIAHRDRRAAYAMLRREIRGHSGRSCCGGGGTGAGPVLPRVQEPQEPQRLALLDEDGAAETAVGDASRAASADSSGGGGGDEDEGASSRILNYVFHALRMLLAGFDMAERTLGQLLRRIQESRLKALKECRMRMHEAVYLVGAPDPLGVLQSGEVFVALYSDRLPPSRPTAVPAPSSPALAAEATELSALSGPVAVTRNPLSHMGDIRLLRAVRHPALLALVAGSSGGVVFFSTKGDNCSEAALMGGGDFDGDVYCVIYNEAVVGHMDPAHPYEPNAAAAAAPPGTSAAEGDACSQSADAAVTAAMAGPLVEPTEDASADCARDMDIIKGE
jgi:hypothetical protein